MTNLETSPAELVCQDVVGGAQVLEPRDVPLGGVRAMTVRRTLPQRARSFIGAWCFCDHYGPDDVAVTGGMRVPPHPHTGLQTVSWLFSGEVEHRDSLGTHAFVRPGEMNLMTAGHGISHSEDSTPATTVLHGVQLWTVLPERHRDVAPAFDHHVPPVVELEDGALRVFLGSLAGSTSPVPTFSPLLGAELVLGGGSEHTFAVDPSFEHGVLVDAGAVEVVVGGPDGATAPPVRAERDRLLYLPPGATALTVRAAGGADLRALLLGGEPLGEQIVMWWNFIGRDHDDVLAARRRWQAEIGAEEDVLEAPPAGSDPAGTADLAAGAAVAPQSDVPGADDGLGEPAVPPSRFGRVEGHAHPPLPAPPIPLQRLKPRG